MVTRVTPGPAAFRAMAHPLRINLLGLLRAEGPSTATRLADRLEVSSGLASYHLRALADAGFITEDSELGTGRDRWWRTAHDLTSWDADVVAVDAAPSALVDVARAHWYALRSRAEADFESTRPDWSAEWRHAAGYTQLLFCLTPAELEEAKRWVFEILEPWLTTSLARRDNEEPTPDGAETVMWFQSVIPVADLAKVLGTGEGPTEVNQ